MTIASYPSSGQDAIILNLDTSGLWSPGNIIQASVRVKWTNVIPHVGATMAHYPKLYFLPRNVDNSFQTGSYGMFIGTSSETAITANLIPPNGEGTLITTRCTLGANVNRLYLDLGWRGAESGAVEFSNMQVWKE